MRCAHRTSMTASTLANALLLVAICIAAGCDASATTTELTSSTVRAARRAYDGSPPVIPHAPLGAACIECHTAEGKESPGLGFAPANPHTHKVGATRNCRQCHVFSEAAESFVESEFVGLRQGLRRGDRLFNGAPPVIPHAVFMRENCAACHSGATARPEIRCTHPERVNCGQCHVVRQTTESAFASE